MNKLLLALALFAATPAAAQSVEVSASGRGLQNVTPGLFVGVGPAQLGAERNRGDTTFSVGVVPSVRLFGSTSLYGNVAGLLTDGDFGYRIGAGVKQGLTEHTYLKVGVRRDNSDPVQGTLALGVRF